jgi:hypothetical protein
VLQILKHLEGGMIWKMHVLNLKIKKPILRYGNICAIVDEIVENVKEKIA